MATVPYIKIDPIIRGDAETLVIEVVDGTGAALDGTDATLWFTAKPAWDSDVLDAAAVIKKSTDGNGITWLAQVGATLGHAEVDIDPADTDSLPAERTKLVLDVQYQEDGGEPRTILRGELPILPDATRRVTVP
jgi:hypothetical protein